MARYILKRLLLSVPTLLALSVIAFFLADLAPGDPVLARMQPGESRGKNEVDALSFRRDYQRQASRMGLDKPGFYFGVQRAMYPDTFYRVFPLQEKRAARIMLKTHGHWPLLSEIRNTLKHIEHTAGQSPGTAEVQNTCAFLRIASQQSNIHYLLDQLAEQAQDKPSLKPAIAQLKNLYTQYLNTSPAFGSFMPKLHWYGLDNRYHHWLVNILGGDFGISNVDGRPVGSKIREALRWTLGINLPVIFLAFFIAIPLGVFAARNKGRKLERITTQVLFGLYAMPSFWLATLFVVFFTTSAYGNCLDIFPTQGLGNYQYANSPWKRFSIIAYHLLLPILSLTLGTLAYLYKQMKQSVVEEMQQDYIMTARAKGISERRLYWNHAARNGLYPIITILGAVFPAAISGSVIIEVIFNIPGMGRLLYFSILSQDWAVVFAMLLLAGVLTIIGYLISDLLYSALDPRVKLQSKNPKA